MRPLTIVILTWLRGSSGSPLHTPMSASLPTSREPTRWSTPTKRAGLIVIARIPPQYAKRGSRFFIEEMIEAKSFSIPATVVKMPFFDPPRKRA